MTMTVQLTLAHSPDCDDVFMWWPITGMIDAGDYSRVVAPPVIDTAPYSFRAVPADIEELNARAAARGDFDITALSYHAYARARERYALTACGSSMGDGYGPRLVALPGRAGVGLLDDIRAGRAGVAVPGRRTTAFLVLSMLLGTSAFRAAAMRFDRVIPAVVSGEADAGLVIHEGQLTYSDHGLALVADLGEWWKREHGLPLPLGANAVRRDLDERFGLGTAARVLGLLRRSVTMALDRFDESLEYARTFAPGLSPEVAERFVRMYVNELSIDPGERGRRAVGKILAAAGVVGRVEMA